MQNMEDNAGQCRIWRTVQDRAEYAGQCRKCRIWRTMQDGAEQCRLWWTMLDSAEYGGQCRTVQDNTQYGGQCRKCRICRIMQDSAEYGGQCRIWRTMQDSSEYGGQCRTVQNNADYRCRHPIIMLSIRTFLGFKLPTIIGEASADLDKFSEGNRFLLSSYLCPPPLPVSRQLGQTSYNNDTEGRKSKREQR